MKRLFALAASLGLVALMLIGSTATAIGTSDQKVWICKYVGTPGVNEHLQTGTNPIVVSDSATGGTAVGSFFSDGQNRSYVLALQTVANTVGGNQYITGSSTCPPPVPPPTGPTTTCAPVGAMGSVGWTGVPDGWQLIIEPNDHLYIQPDLSSLSLPAGTYTFQFRDANGNDTIGGTFTIAVCSTPAVVAATAICTTMDPPGFIHVTFTGGTTDPVIVIIDSVSITYAVGDFPVDIGGYADGSHSVMIMQGHQTLLDTTVTVACTTGSITFVKVITGTDKGPAALSAFTFRYVGSNANPPPSFGTAKNGDVKTLPDRTYTISEVTPLPANYTLDSVSCVPTFGARAVGTNQATLTVAQPNWTCRITNHYTAPSPPPPVPVVSTACGGSVTFTSVLAGWTYRIDSTTGTAIAVTTTSVGPLAEGVGSHTYQFIDAAGAIVSGSFAIVACPPLPPPPTCAQLGNCPLVIIVVPSPSPSASPSPSPSPSPTPTPTLVPTPAPTVTPVATLPPNTTGGGATPPPTSTLTSGDTGSSPVLPVSLGLFLVGMAGLLFTRRQRAR